MHLLLWILFCFPAFALEYGIDRLSEEGSAALLEGKSLAVLTHAAGVDKTGKHLIDLLHQRYHLVKIFAPEHGLRTLADEWVSDGTDEATGLPVISLYKQGSKAPRPEDLQGIDSVVVDLQDVGVRYYTYFSTIAEVMRVAASVNVEVILLDRPNLLGRKIEGKTLDAALAGSFTAYHTVPTRHGMTLGELSRLVNAERSFGAKLSVIPVRGWSGEMLTRSLDRAWIPPSPALVSPLQVELYALWGTLENFNLAVGRGQTNEKAFSVLGAPWITEAESKSLAFALNQLKLPELQFTATQWTVTRVLYQGQLVRGVRIEGDPRQARTDEVTYKVASELVKRFPERLNLSRMSPAFYGSASYVDSIRQGRAWGEMVTLLNEEIQAFRQRITPYLLYP